MTESPGPDAHLGLDRIADLEEGLLSPAEEQAARDHLAGCDECQADLAALAGVHAALLADAEIAMPDDIADRIYGALAELAPLAPASAAATTLPVRTGPSRWERSQKPLLATLAAAAGIALLTVGIIHLPRSSGSKATSAAGAAVTTAAAPAVALQVLHSGHNYNAKTLGSDGAALVSPPTSAAAAAPTSAAAAATTAAAAAATSAAAPAPTIAAAPTAAAPAQGSTAASSAAAVTTAAAPASSAAVPAAPAPTTDALSELRDPGAAQRCVALLVGSTTPPRVLDYATFDGKPAVIAVVDAPNDATKLAVIAVGPPGCSLYSLNFVSKP